MGTILGLQLFLLLAAIDQTVISTAMPKIVEQLGGFDRYSWATAGYLLTSTLAVPVAGKLSDMYGRRLLLLLSVGLFIVASILCGMAQSMPGFPLDGMNQLIFFRLVQGIGGGGIVSLAFTVVGDLFTPHERGRYQGYFAAVFALASIAGPALGGYVADTFSWRWLFFVNVPVGFLGTWLFWACYWERHHNPIVAGFDWRGLILFCLSSSIFLVGVSSPSLPKHPYTTALWLFISALLFWLFVKVEKSVPNPFLPIGLMRQPIILISIISLAVYGVGMFGGILLVPLLMQGVRGLSAGRSGLILSPLIVTVALASVIGGLWMSRTGKYKVIILTGLLCMAVGMAFLATLNADVSLSILFSTFMVISVGIGLLLPIYTVVIQNSVSDELVGTVTGLSQFFRSAGGTLGVACFGSLLLGLYNANLAMTLPPGVPPNAVQAMTKPLDRVKLRLALSKALTATSPDAGSSSNEKLEATLEGLTKDALYRSMQQIHLIYTTLLTATFLLNLLLEELTLRKTWSEPTQKTRAQQ
jgi:EmrB/QacA subfamily drug resistance transporter